MDVVRQSMLDAANSLVLPDDLTYPKNSQAPRYKNKDVSVESYIEDYMYHLPENYRMLAWQIAQCFSDTATEKIGANLKPAHERMITSPGSASTLGIIGMVRAVYILPFVYVAQRDIQARMEMDTQSQVLELAQIAKESTGYLEVIARESVPVSGMLERNFYLRNALTKNSIEAYKDFNYTYRLAEIDGRLKFTLAQQNLEGMIGRISDSYTRDTGEQPRKVGCLALKVCDEAGEDVFHKTWQAIIEYCASNPEFFAKDIQEIESFVEEYGFAAR